MVRADGFAEKTSTRDEIPTAGGNLPSAVAGALAGVSSDTPADTPKSAPAGTFADTPPRTPATVGPVGRAIEGSNLSRTARDPRRTELRHRLPAPSDLTIDDIYGEQLHYMHGIATDPAEQGRVGRTWRIDPTFGEGVYWYYPIDGIMSVNAFEMVFHQETGFSCETPDLFCFGSYGRNMVPYFGITEDQADRTLVGYAWRGQPYSQRIAANKPLDVVSVCLLPRGIKRVGLALGCDPLVLGRALTELDGTRDVAGLNTCLDEMRRARPSAALAPAYYEAKIVEACALLVDWSLANPAEATHPMSAADRTALTLARTYLADNLERVVGTEELCRVACVSASKLTRLFKQAEGTTPQGYARALRMERACALLDGSDLTIAEVSAALGFARQGSFSEAFHDRFGVTPRAFRTTHQSRRAH